MAKSVARLWKVVVNNVNLSDHAFAVEGVDEKVAQRAMQLAAAKLPIKCRFVIREQQL